MEHNEAKQYTLWKSQKEQKKKKGNKSYLNKQWQKAFQISGVILTYRSMKSKNLQIGGS